MGQEEQIARELAAKGEEEVNRVLAIAGRARELLDDPSFEVPVPAWEPYLWQVEESMSAGMVQAIYLASVDDFAQGEGLTMSFFVGKASGVNAFRRRIAREIGAELADHAVIGKGSDAKVPFGSLFLTPPLRAKLEAIERGEEGPGTFFYIARLRANYS